MGASVRDKLVDAALRILETAGVKKLGQTVVAREAGVPQGHLTYYFPKKGDLVAAVLERFSVQAADELGQRLASAEAAGDIEPGMSNRLAAGDDPSASKEPLPSKLAAARRKAPAPPKARPTGLPAWPLALAARVMRDHRRSRALLGFVVESDGDPEVRALLVARVARVRGLLAALLGRPADDADVELALATLWGLGMQELLLHGERPAARLDDLIERLAQWWAAAPPTSQRR